MRHQSLGWRAGWLESDRQVQRTIQLICDLHKLLCLPESWAHPLLSERVIRPLLIQPRPESSIKKLYQNLFIDMESHLARKSRARCNLSWGINVDLNSIIMVSRSSLETQAIIYFIWFLITLSKPTSVSKFKEGNPQRYIWPSTDRMCVRAHF